jgi:hypothetical protein
LVVVGGDHDRLKISTVRLPATASKPGVPPAAHRTTPVGRKPVLIRALESQSSGIADDFLVLPFPDGLEVWLGNRISQSATDLGPAKTSAMILYTQAFSSAACLKSVYGVPLPGSRLRSWSR